MKILITGSTGGIGQVIAKQCTEHHHDVHCLLRNNHDLSKKVNINAQNIDALIYCAGINKPSSYKDLSEDNIQKTFRINVLSFIEMCQQIHFNDGANIIVIGSLYATETRADRLAYTMSKHAMYGAVKTLAIEMAKQNIKVNMVSPGFVLTPLTQQNNTLDRIQYLQNSIPLGMTQPSDIADVCIFLLNNRNMTGQNIIIDGGYSLIGI